MQILLLNPLFTSFSISLPLFFNTFSLAVHSQKVCTYIQIENICPRNIYHSSPPSHRCFFLLPGQFHPSGKPLHRVSPLLPLPTDRSVASSSFVSTPPEQLLIAAQETLGRDALCTFAHLCKYYSLLSDY